MKKAGVWLVPLAGLLSASVLAAEVKASAEYPEFYNGDSTKGIDFVQSIRVLAPRYCSNVKGDVTVVFEAKGMTRVLARCWKHGGAWGSDAVLAPLASGATIGDGFRRIVSGELQDGQVVLTSVDDVAVSATLPEKWRLRRTRTDKRFIRSVG